ncbi:MAG TPA: helix-turn-helix domain-containing protein [Pseudolabrys sp.]|nr:helix-turn-helix domain-containing protein [Pseudolabrys sp.]
MLALRAVARTIILNAALRVFVMATAIEPLTYSATKAARLLGVGKNKMLALISAGRIPARNLDGRYRVLASDVAAFVAALPVATKLDAPQSQAVQL